MPITPTIIEAANLFRARLLARERRAATSLVRYYGISWQRLQGDITALSTEVETMRLAGEEVSRGRIARLERLRAIQVQVETEMAGYAQFASEDIIAQKRESLVAGERDSANLIQYAFPPGSSINIDQYRMPRAAVENLVGFMQDGSPLRDVIAKYAGDAAEDFGATMVTGLTAGWGPRKLAQELRQAYGMGLTDSLRLARTENLRAYRTASRQTYEANSDVVKGWQRHADRGDRTCLACIMLDSTFYTVAQDMDDHVMGRCTLLPVTKTYAELGIDAPEPQFQEETAREWFERQDEATQRKMMGEGKFEAWKAGEFTLEDIPHKTTDAVWGDSWTPRPLYELLGADAPVGTYAEWAAVKVPADDWLSAIRKNPGIVLDEPDTPDARMQEWLKSGLPSDQSPTDKAGFAKNEIVTMLSERTGIPYEDCNKFVAQWSESSNDNDMRSLAIQEDAAKMLGIDLPQWQKDQISVISREYESYIARITNREDETSYIGTRESVDAWLRETNPKYFPIMDSDKQQRLLRTMYDHTQERLDAAGIGDTIRLRRGFTIPDDDFAGWRDRAPNRNPLLQTVEYNGSMLESWSVDTRTARDFALDRNYGETGVVFEMDIPRERLIGSARSGFGCLSEFEFVHLGAFGDEAAMIVEVIAK